MENYKVSSEDLEKFMEVALRFVREADQLIRINIRKAKRLDEKSPEVMEGHSSHVLTETDQAVEELLIKGLSGEFPDHRFISEEDMGSLTGQIPEYSSNPTWIIDPIDGTMNFVHGNPLNCISIGLAVNRRLVLGIVSVPMIGHTYTAIKGKGAFLNGDQPLKSSGVKKLADAMVLMELPTGANNKKRENAIFNTTALMSKANAIRCPGPAALDIAWIGAGSSDAFYHFGIHCWDMAAGAIIVTEAGGCILNSDGSEFNLMGRTCVVASTEELARELVSVIRKIPYEPEFNEHCPI